MRADSESRLRFINLMVDSLDKEVQLTWNKLCKLIEQDNAVFNVSTIKVFTYKREYYPADIADRFKKPVLRKLSVELDDSLVEEFEESQQTLVKDYASFKRKFKFMLSEICRVAVSPADFEAVIPETVFRLPESVSYTPLRTAKGWQESELTEFIDKYKPVLDKAKYYLGVRQLI